MTPQPEPEDSSPTHSRRRFWSWVLLITAGAALLRFWGLGFGLPLDLRPDEDVFRRAVEGMVARGDADPQWYFYPGLPFHLLFAALAVTHAVAAFFGLPGGSSSLLEWTSDPVLVTWVQRALSAACGTLTVPALAALARRIGGRSLGLSAALLLALLPLHVRDSHFGTADVLSALLVTLALHASVRAASAGTMTAFVLAGLVAGAATASRYLPALLAVSLVVASSASCLKTRAPLWQQFAGPRLVAAALSMVTGFLLCAPYTVLNWTGFRDAMLNLRGMSGVTGGGEPFPSLPALWQTTLLDGMTWPLVGAAALGLLLVMRRPVAGWNVVLAFGLAHAVLLGSSNLQFVRHGMALAPVVALLASHALQAAAAGIPARWRTPGGVVLVVLLGLSPLSRSIGHARLLARPTSFQLLADWMAQDLDADALLVATSGEITRITRPPCRVLPGWDPVRIAAQKEAWLVVAAHPHPAFGPSTGVQPLVGSFSEHEVVFEVRALGELAWSGSRWEESDAFYFPLAGTRHVSRGGPDVQVIHVRGPGGGRSAARLMKPPVHLHVERTSRGLRLAWEPSGEPGVAGWYLRLAPDEQVRRGSLPKPLALPAGRSWLVITDPPAGRYLACVSAVNVLGEGPWSAVVPFSVTR